MNLDTVGTWVAFGLTLLVYAYLVKELPLFDVVYRVVAYIFVGVALAYAAIQAWHGVLVPRLFVPLGAKEWFYLVPATKLNQCLKMPHVAVDAPFGDQS